MPHNCLVRQTANQSNPPSNFAFAHIIFRCSTWSLPQYNSVGRTSGGTLISLISGSYETLGTHFSGRGNCLDLDEDVDGWWWRSQTVRLAIHHRVADILWCSNQLKSSSLSQMKLICFDMSIWTVQCKQSGADLIEIDVVAGQGMARDPALFVFLSVACFFFFSFLHASVRWCVSVCVFRVRVRVCLRYIGQPSKQTRNGK